VVGAGLAQQRPRTTTTNANKPGDTCTTLGAATGATARGRTEFPQLAALWPRERPGETSNDRRKRKINGGRSWPRPARAGRGGTCAVRREREKKGSMNCHGSAEPCLGEREREQRAVEVLATTRAYVYRILWTCFKLERLAAFIDGKTVALDVSVLLHAILGDEVVSQVLQSTESIFAEVFAFLDEWQGVGAAKALVFVFDRRRRDRVGVLGDDSQGRVRSTQARDSPRVGGHRASRSRAHPQCDQRR
jgi:hypothetical protein